MRHRYHWRVVTVLDLAWSYAGAVVLALSVSAVVERLLAGRPLLPLRARVGLGVAIVVIRGFSLSDTTVEPDRLSTILDQQRQAWDAEMARLERVQREAAGQATMRSVVDALRAHLADDRGRAAPRGARR